MNILTSSEHPRHIYESASTFPHMVYPDVFACLPYQHPSVKPLVWCLKNTNNMMVRQALSTTFIDALEALRKQGRINPPYWLIPIPSSHARLRERGFNQCIHLTKDTEHNLRLHKNTSPSSHHLQIGTHLPLLSRTKDIPHQKQASREERLTRLKGIFKISPKHAQKFQTNIKHLEPSHTGTLIVIDDVTTTGSSLTEALRILRESEYFKNVPTIGLAFAH